MSELSAQFGGAVVSDTDATITETAAIPTGMSAFDMQQYDRLTVYVDNSGAQNVAAVVVQSAPETTGPWVNVDTDLLSGVLAGGATGYGTLTGLALKYVRVTLETAPATTTTATVWICVGGYSE